MHPTIVKVNTLDNYVLEVAFDTIEWPCGVDLAPEFVYNKSEKTFNC